MDSFELSLVKRGKVLLAICNFNGHSMTLSITRSDDTWYLQLTVKR